MPKRILPKRFEKNVVVISKLKFFQISSIFRTWFGWLFTCKYNK